MNRSIKACFGDLSRVFPMGPDGLRASPPDCLACPDKTGCLKTAMNRKDGLSIQSDLTDNAYRQGLIGFAERWSKKKDIHRKRTRYPTPPGPPKKPERLILLITALGVLAAAVAYHAELLSAANRLYTFIADRDAVSGFISRFGVFAPLVFIGLQILQVVIAPIPGEASGIIGGYLFGVYFGFFYSSIGLAVGSAINFFLGRFLGRRYLRKRIPERIMTRFDAVANHKAALLLIFLFVFPGFPKDYLCLFLGISTLPARTFVLMSSFGRMPGTLMLSLQGSLLYDRAYTAFLVLLAAMLLLALIGWRYRGRWIKPKTADPNGISPPPDARL